VSYFSGGESSAEIYVAVNEDETQYSYLDNLKI